MQRLEAAVEDDLLNYLNNINERIENLTIDIDNISSLETIYNVLRQVNTMRPLARYMQSLKDNIDDVFKAHEKQIDSVYSHIKTLIPVDVENFNPNFFIDL